ncbi:MAG: ABC transporter ATP-binding protein [Alphaproteobacteria bacterium]|nr:ABC transporter ATP-binding protein [Alphaproteobacteria bacterium]MCW5741457.1 ABC transporter ATP-binding protein [Alphaproteobacteria bacterium]
MAGVSLRTIGKSFGATEVLRDVSLDIGEREFLTLLGPSGCGKSTLLRVIAGLERQDLGSVIIGGRAIDGLRPAERDVAMVFQSYALYPHMSAGENIAVPLMMRRSRPWQRLPVLRWMGPQARRIRRDVEAEVARVASSLDIGHLLARRPGQLSGGQRQRVALARAMVRQPRAFLMDEPLSNLDAKLRVQARAEIAELHRRLATTFVYVTHDQAEAMTMSDRVAVMMDGRILQVAAPSAIYDDPADLRVAEFVGSPRINTLGGVIRKDGAVEVDGTIMPIRPKADAGSRVTLAFRPEHATLDAHDAVGAIPGVVRHRENLGSDLFAHVLPVGARQPLILRLEPQRIGEVPMDSAVGIRPSPLHILAFDADGRRLARFA